MALWRIPSSLLALQVDLRELRSKLSWIRFTFSSDTLGRPELLSLHRQPICSNWWFQRQMLFLVAGWMLKRRRNARCTAVADSVLMNSRKQKNLVLHSSHFALNWSCCTALGERSSGGILKFRTFSFKCYVDHSHTMYSSGNIDVRNWVNLFESRCISLNSSIMKTVPETSPRENQRKHFMCISFFFSKIVPFVG